MDHSLLDRLKSLGVQIGASQVKPAPIQERVPIDRVVPGIEHATLFGSAFLADENFPADYRHGLIPFAQQVDYHILGEWAGYPDLAQQPLDNFVFLDTETSGLAGGTGTFAFMVGIGWWEQTGFHLQQFFMREPAEETAMLAALDEVLTPFRTVVTFNGKSFDIPLLNGRHTLSAFKSPFPDMEHVDLLALSRRVWRNRLPSRALGSLEQDILAITRTQEEIPGWMIPEMYFEYLKTGDSRPLAGVFYHNKMDILSLAALFLHLSNMLTSPMDWLAEEGLDLIAIAKLYEEIGRREQSINLYEHSLSLGLPRPFFIQTLYRYAEVARKGGEFDQAAQLWQKAADYQEWSACLELAKYYEHRQRDYQAALQWTQQARQYLEASLLPKYMLTSLLNELQKREDRLHHKLSRYESLQQGQDREENNHGE